MATHFLVRAARLFEGIGQDRQPLEGSDVVVPPPTLFGALLMLTPLPELLVIVLPDTVLPVAVTPERGGEREVQFLRWHEPAILPVWYQGQLRLARWGCRDRESRFLPPTAWTWRATVEAGRWIRWGAENVDIPASMALEGKVWYTVREGLKGLLVRDERGRPRVYVICQPVSHYYEVMTRARWMPVLIGQQI